MPAFSLPLGAAYVVITATTAIIWTILAWLIRLFIRLKIHGPFSWDDIHCTIATTYAVLQSCLTISSTSSGLGHHIDSLCPSTLNYQHLLGWVSAFMFLLALCFSMLSVCFLIARVTKRTEQVRIAYAIAALTVLWGVISIFVVAFQCDLPQPWQTVPRSRCFNIVCTQNQHEGCHRLMVFAVPCLAGHHHCQSASGTSQYHRGRGSALERQDAVETESHRPSSLLDQTSVRRIEPNISSYGIHANVLTASYHHL